MRMYSQVFAGAGVWPLAVPGQLFRIIQTDGGEPVDITFYRGGSSVAQATGMEAGFFAKPQGGFDRVDITSATAQTVKVLIMDGDGGYDRFIVDINSSIGDIGVTVAQAGTVTDVAPVTVGVAATALVAASATRKALRFYNDGAAVIYLGGAAVTTANGAIKVAPGQLWLESDGAAAAWYGISGTAGQSMRVQEVA